MKVKEEDLRRELLKAINGEDLIINCARRLGLRLNNFKCKLYTARICKIRQNDLPISS